MPAQNIHKPAELIHDGKNIGNKRTLLPDLYNSTHHQKSGKCENYPLKQYGLCVKRILNYENLRFANREFKLKYYRKL